MKCDLRETEGNELQIFEDDSSNDKLRPALLGGSFIVTLKCVDGRKTYRLLHKKEIKKAWKREQVSRMLIIDKSPFPRSNKRAS